MKIILTTILFFVIAFPCFGELTANDVRRIIREELSPVKKEIEVIKKDIESVKIEIATIKGDIKAMDTKFETKFQSIEERISLLQWFIGALVAIVVAAIAIPQLLILYRERKETTEISQLREVIAELKGKKLITP